MNTALEEVLRSARRRMREHGSCLVEEVLAGAACGKEALPQLAAHELDISFLTQESLMAMPAIFSRLSFTDCVQRAVYPAQLGGKAVFAVADPWDERLVQWLANRLGAQPALAWSARADIQRALDKAHQNLNASNGLAAPSRQQAADSNAVQDFEISIESIERSASPVVRFVDAAIYDAWRSGASDIHFECSRQGVKVKLRLDGVLVTSTELPDAERAEEVISRIKVLAQLDIAERRVPQDGRFRVRLGGRDLDFRVSIMPSIVGEDAVVRLLDKSQLRGDEQSMQLTGLGFDIDAIQRIRRLARRPHGMLLVTGPTGSGKTTTLYAALSEIQNEQEKIITIEDPVEYELPGVLQIPVNEKKGLTFSQGLRSILRHDPDKILVGEIRDSETAEIAVQAALTGHLVFTTVHANGVHDVISRFTHMDVDLYSLMSALNGVVAQRLIRCICPQCKQPASSSPELLARCRDAGIESTAMTLAHGRGCDHCRGTGYKGRYAIAEVLPFDDTLREMVLRRGDVREVKRYAQSLGVRPLGARALQLVVNGTTTLEEIDRVIAHE
jgi:general secretion pathway protein E